MLAVVLALVLPSTAVAVTLRLTEPLQFAGGIIVRPTSCAARSVQLPLALRIPADRLAPAGRFEMLIDSVPCKSTGASAAEMASGTGTSSIPTAACTANTGVSATDATDTDSDAPVLAVVPFSCDVAVTVRATLPFQFAAGMNFKPVNCAGVSVQLPPPLLVPADSVAPAGRPATVMVSVSDPSMSCSAAAIIRGTGASSTPTAALTDSSGVVATP